MAHAGGRAEDSAILRDREHLSFHLGPYVYEIVHAGSETTFWVSDRTHSITVPLGWAFGEGEVGQTFLFERGGTYYEGHLSFFPVLSPLDVTPGHDHSMLLDLDQALGRRMDADETQRCFGCHTTASTLRHGFTQEVPTWRFLLAEEMDGLDRLVRRIATLPGQRTILLIASHGFFCMGCWAEKVADDALRAKVVISTLDAAGLPVLLRETDAAWSPAPGSESGRVIGDMHMADFTMRFHLSGLMSWFAATTGGEFFRNHNDLERGFEKLLAGPEVYYVLEFHPRTSSTMEDGTL